MTNLSVAQTILQQLGDNRFIAMTGARNFVGGQNELRFRLPRNSMTKTNMVRIILDAATDTYTMEFYIGQAMWPVLNTTRIGVYADQLRDTFTSATGLYTRL